MLDYYSVTHLHFNGANLLIPEKKDVGELIKHKFMKDESPQTSRTFGRH